MSRRGLFHTLSEVVFESGRHGREQTRRARQALRSSSPALAPDSPAALLWFATSSPRGRPRAARASVPLIVALAIHAGLAGWITYVPGAAARNRAAHAARPAMTVEHIVEITAPPAPPAVEQETAPAPPVAARKKLAVRRSAAAKPRKAAPTRPAAKPAPAAAGQVVAAADAAPLDFTGFDIAQGDGPRYAGGITTQAGTQIQAVHAPEVEANGSHGAPSAQLAQPVRLNGHAWHCPWPGEAAALAVREQIVELRVVVEADGRVSNVQVQHDPGHGFAKAASRCARRTRFEPALDAQGRAVRAQSPRIRVRFTP